MRKSTVSVMVSSIVLSACGGGGGGDSTKSTISSTPATTAQVTEPTELFASTPIFLPDVKSRYDQLCGRRANVQNAIPVDINKDGKMDIVFNLACLQPQFGVAFSGDVPNMLIALVQDKDGNFVDKTTEVFGTEKPNIGGIGIFSVVSDFNNDGIKDIVYAVNREDGRLVDSTEIRNHRSSAVALISNGTGYNIVKINEPEYGYSVALKENIYGKNDVVLLPFSTSSAYTYDNGWKKLPGYDWVSNTSTVFFKAISPGLGSTIAVTPSPHPRTGVELWKGYGNNWSKVHEYKYAEPELVMMKSWTGNTGLVPLIKLDGQDYIGPSMAGVCEIKKTKNSESEALMLFAANIVIGGYKGQTLVEGDKNTMKGVHKLISFSVNSGGAITKTDLKIQNEREPSAFYRLNCLDVNGDGVDDITYHEPQGGPPSGGTVIYPTIYLNDGNGSFNRVSDKWFPRPPNGSSYVYEDFNGDGIKDLLYFPLTGYEGSDNDHGSLPHGHLIQSNSVKYHLYLGKRKLKSSDLM